MCFKLTSFQQDPQRNHPSGLPHELCSPWTNTEQSSSRRVKGQLPTLVPLSACRSRCSAVQVLHACWGVEPAHSTCTEINCARGAAESKTDKCGANRDLASSDFSLKVQITKCYFWSKCQYVEVWSPTHLLPCRILPQSSNTWQSRSIQVSLKCYLIFHSWYFWEIIMLLYRFM